MKLFVYALSFIVAVQGYSINPCKQIIKKIAAVSTSFLLLGTSVVSADSFRTVGEITTNGIIFKDTLKITG
jgi:tryptophan synthase alpha subunit